MKNKFKIRGHKSTNSAFTAFMFSIFTVLALILFSFFGIITLITCSVFALIASALRFVTPSGKKNANYDIRTKTLTLEKNDYEVIENDK